MTLVREAGARCFGLAYALAPDRAPAVLDQLDHRERGGYERLDVELDLPEHGDPHVFEIEALAAALVDSDPPGSSIPRRTPCDS